MLDLSVIVMRCARLEGSGIGVARMKGNSCSRHVQGELSLRPCLSQPPKPFKYGYGPAQRTERDVSISRAQSARFETSKRSLISMSPSKPLRPLRVQALRSINTRTSSNQSRRSSWFQGSGGDKVDDTPKPRRLTSTD